VRKTATLLLLLMLVSTAAFAAGAGPFYAKGDYYAGTVGTWNGDAGNLLTYNSGTGFWSGVVTCDQAYSRHEFKIADASWSESYYPWCNLWVHCGTGDQVLFTLDTNTYADGWFPTTNIVWGDHMYPVGTTFEVIGGAAETGNWGGGPAPVPAATLVGGIWTLAINIATPGSYEAKFRATGTWDVCNIGEEGAAAPCGANLHYTTLNANELVTFQFNPATGRARVVNGSVVPAQKGSWGQVKTLYR
jgi:hypothetical protein